MLRVAGFSDPVRMERDLLVSWRKCIYVKERCKNYTLKESYCSEDIELLSLSFRPFYLPREFGQLFIIVVDIHPRVNSRLLQM